MCLELFVHITYWTAGFVLEPKLPMFGAPEIQLYCGTVKMLLELDTSPVFSCDVHFL